MRLGIVTGMAREAESLIGAHGGASENIIDSGIGPERAEAIARRMVNEGCTALLSCGIAGGLDPQRKAGDVVIADTVLLHGGQKLETHHAWREAAAQALAGEPICVGTVFGSDKVIPTTDGKRQCFEATGAVAVDMESHAVARVASEAGVPFLVLRVVCDPSTRNLPHWVRKALRPDGGVRPAPMLWGVLTHPVDVPVLLGLAGDSKRAYGTLSRVAGVLGPAFGLP